MSFYNDRIGLGKQGANLIRTITDDNQCYFHEIVQENDVGIDAFIEFTKNGENTGRCIAVQIKTGDSYFNTDKSECKIPIGSHYSYWKNHSLQVYGFVCDYERKEGFWVSITDFIEQHGKDIESGILKHIVFPTMEMNKLTTKTFGEIFKPLVYGLPPHISLSDSLSFSRSQFLAEKILSVDSLLGVYSNDISSWDRCFSMLCEEIDKELLSKIVFYFSYIPRYPDLYGDLSFSQETKQYAKTLLLKLDKQTIIKLLGLLDDVTIHGRTKQCVASLISIVPNRKQLLIEIIEEYFNTEYIGIFAFMILSYYEPTFVLENSKHYVSLLKNWAESTIDFIKDFGSFDLYI